MVAATCARAVPGLAIVWSFTQTWPGAVPCPRPRDPCECGCCCCCVFTRSSSRWRLALPIALATAWRSGSDTTPTVFRAASMSGRSSEQISAGKSEHERSHSRRFGSTTSARSNSVHIPALSAVSEGAAPSSSSACARASSKQAANSSVTRLWLTAPQPRGSMLLAITGADKQSQTSTAVHKYSYDPPPWYPTQAIYTITKFDFDCACLRIANSGAVGRSLEDARSARPHPTTIEE